MPRHYVREVGKRPYAQFSKTQLSKALEAKKSGKSLREVEKEFGVKRSTLSRHYGRSSVFTEEDEEVLVECISAAGEWGLPFKNYDVRCFVKCHLDRIGVKVERF